VLRMLLELYRDLVLLYEYSDENWSIADDALFSRSLIETDVLHNAVLHYAVLQKTYLLFGINFGTQHECFEYDVYCT
jgi:hypothetical protein